MKRHTSTGVHGMEIPVYIPVSVCCPSTDHKLHPVPMARQFIAYSHNEKPECDSEADQSLHYGLSV